MSEFDTLEMRRALDGLVYRFHKMQRPDGSTAYRREDKDVWIVRHPDWAWIVWEDETASVSGRPWSILPKEQGDRPPDGEWVSKKGGKSYVYRLVYVQAQ